MKSLTKISYESIFISIQGEGPRAGIPSLFLRLSGCNLLCSFCDTREAVLKEFSHRWRKEEISKLTNKIKKEKKAERNFVITGGEPLLQKESIYKLLKNLKKEFSSFEIETNGTISPDKLKNIKSLYFNVSPKLTNSGIPENKRIKPQLHEFSALKNSFFKFVINNNNDLEEVLEIVEKFSIRKEKVFLMPMSKTSKELKLKAKEVYKLSIKYGFNYSDRLHLRLGVK